MTGLLAAVLQFILALFTRRARVNQAEKTYVEAATRVADANSGAPADRSATIERLRGKGF